MAQAAEMSSEAFEDFYFAVCTADYAAMARNQEPLRKRMAAADRVRLTGAGTDLEFSIKGVPAIPCNGEHNIPDGEVFTAPVKESIEGVIRFNTPSLYQGTVVRSQEPRILNLDPPATMRGAQQQRYLDFLETLNRDHLSQRPAPTRAHPP